MEHKARNIKHGAWSTRQGGKSKIRSSVPCSMFHVPYSRGFTIVELVVTIAIFLIITSMIMVSQRRFGGNILITNLAYDMALSIRQAQAYGISVKRATQVTDLSQQFNKSYGIHFALTGAFVLFTDINGDGRYNTEADDGIKCQMPSSVTYPEPECVTVFKIERGNSIAKFCGGTDCTDSIDIDKQIDGLDILFHRPDPEPIIRASKEKVVKEFPYANASVTVASPQGVSKTVIISANGQVSIQ